MTFITLPNSFRFLLSVGIISLLNSCGVAKKSYGTSSAPAYAFADTAKSFRNNTSSATKVIVKTGSMNMDASDVRETGEQIEKIITNHGGHILSLHERDDKKQSASYSLRVPAEHLINSMDQIAELGKVTYRRVTVTDKTKESIAQKARLNKLKQRQKRLLSMYNNTKNLSDKLDIEKTLADIEEEIFSMEEAIRDLAKFYKYSNLTISIAQKKIRGPVGATIDGVGWTWSKLFTIRE